MHYLKNSHLIKPNRWGSDLDVKNAVRHYYENTLGVAAPVLYMPFMTGSKLGFDAAYKEKTVVVYPGVKPVTNVVSFDTAVNGKITVGNDSSIQNLLAFSVRFRANLTSDYAGTGFTGKGGNGGYNGWGLSSGNYTGRGEVKFTRAFSGPAQIFYTAEGVTEIGKFNNYLLTADGTIYSAGTHFYKNSAEVTYASRTDAAGTVPAADASYDLLIGYAYNQGYTYNGLYDSIMLFNYVLPGYHDGNPFYFQRYLIWIRDGKVVDYSIH